MFKPSRIIAPLFLAVIISGSVAAANYDGSLTLFVVEPDSRWTDALGTKYSFGFLDFAASEAVTVIEKERWTGDYVFNATAAGYGDVTPGNLMVIAVVTTDQSVLTDANPPTGTWFDAFYVDAAAAATPDSISSNETSAGFTHTVFLEEATDGG